eukprot:CAMPEP_0170212826 /NCGR_PEP_ID=MMETSP0116_2-20130129/6035_1 /TAXON_ID=400756 /ORGANISM="Durinskia baltica, Strain CSIRO CS-38" /LENGTH=275 /DNA_ID=CAMNT_0010463373 /DNA_START=8 /DNA_END=831 /DNA_ORIENTATION=-
MNFLQFSWLVALASTNTLALTPTSLTSRRAALGWVAGSWAAAGICVGPAHADVDTEDFIRTGMVSMPMGVSGQAGKSKPTTGVVLRDGSEVSRDARSGDVLAEILVKKNGGGTDNVIPVVATFTSPWPLATGSVFDVECRDSETGDAAFLAVSPNVDGTSLADLKDSFFTKALFSPTGRFSFYGQPTDIKVKTASMDGEYRVLDVSFSTLSQSTQTEIPRKARVIATIPGGSSQAVMLVGSASALRWKKGADKKVIATVESFKATPAPQTGLRVR